MPNTFLLLSHPIQAFALERKKSQLQICRLLSLGWFNDLDVRLEVSPNIV